MYTRKFVCKKCRLEFWRDLDHCDYFDGKFTAICPKCGEEINVFLPWHPAYGLYELENS